MDGKKIGTWSPFYEEISQKVFNLTNDSFPNWQRDETVIMNISAKLQSAPQQRHQWCQHCDPWQAGPARPQPAPSPCQASPPPPVTLWWLTPSSHTEPWHRKKRTYCKTPSTLQEARLPRLIQGRWQSWLTRLKIRTKIRFRKLNYKRLTLYKLQITGVIHISHKYKGGFQIPFYGICP